MLIVPGTLAFSHFRTERLLAQINYLVPQVNSLSASFVYFISLRGSLSKLESDILSNLLNCCSIEAPYKNLQEKMLFVVSKVGTRSSWSQKATDVIHQCGLHQVQRIERGIAYTIQAGERLTWGDEQAIANLLHHPPLETVFYGLEGIECLFKEQEVRPVQSVDVLGGGRTALIKAGRRLGLNVLEREINRLLEICNILGRNLTDVELVTIVMFGASSHQYGFFRSNKAIIDNERKGCFFVEPAAQVYQYCFETMTNIITTTLCHSELNSNIVAEVQSEIAIGRGGKPKTALCGYDVSSLHIPGFEQPWEVDDGGSKNMTSALTVMIEAPVEVAQFNNAFGRPNLVGYFRTYEQLIPASKTRQEMQGYHKPIFVLGGKGCIRQRHIHQKPILSGMKIIVLGSSTKFGEDAEMHRRCQEVITSCTAFGFENPIVAMHVIGKMGIAGILSDLIDNAKKGIYIELRDILLIDSASSPLEIWRDEGAAQYLLVIAEIYCDVFQKIAVRENCPFAMIGQFIDTPEVQVYDRLSKTFPIRLPSRIFFNGFSSRCHKTLKTEVPKKQNFSSLQLDEIPIEEIIFRLLRFPCIADKSFLITICDRSASGLVTRDVMVGPWQVPVADCVVTVKGFDTYQGEAMAIGERTPLAIIDPIAGVRMAIGEAITNIAAASIGVLSDIHLLMDCAGNSQLYDPITVVKSAFCSALGVTVPVVQDLPSMQAKWGEHGEKKTFTAPLSFVASAFSPVIDVRRTLTPVLALDQGESVLVFIDLSGGNQRLGQSALAQVFNQIGDSVPDVGNPELLRAFFTVIQQLNLEGKLLAYHDRSDGGLLITLCEMAFASHVGLRIDISTLGKDPHSILFNEELGVVIQIRSEDIEAVFTALEDGGIFSCYILGHVDEADQISIIFREKIICSYERVLLQQAWSETSFYLQSLRDNPRCAKKQYEMICDQTDPGLNVHLTFDPLEKFDIPMLNIGVRPRVAILREQGTHSHIEMAVAFDKAQFECVDVHTNDLHKGHVSLSEFKGLVVCAGFSFGDVLGAGLGWAKKILFNANLKDQFENFFNRDDTFTLGVANGCQMLSGLRSLIPGANVWPIFVQNYSEQFEGRLCLVEVQESGSILLEGMIGSRLPIPIACKEGRVDFVNEEMQEAVLKQKLVTLRYVDNWGRKTQAYPANPSGSPLGITGLTTPNGRVTIMMPQPCRAFRTVQYSWHPTTWGEDGPWLRLFQNARKWVK